MFASFPATAAILSARAKAPPEVMPTKMPLLLCRVLAAANGFGPGDRQGAIDHLRRDVIVVELGDSVTALAYWRWFPVAARNSTFVYKGSFTRVRIVLSFLRCSGLADSMGAP